jgi:hypothetical protein
MPASSRSSTSSKRFLFFEPGTGNIIAGGLKSALLYIAFKSGGELKYNLEGKEAGAKAAYARVISDNGVYYVFTLDELDKLYTIELKDDFIIKFGGKSITLKRGTVVTYQEPFAKKLTLNGKEYLLPAVVEYPENKEARGNIVTVAEEGGRMASKGELPYGYYRQYQHIDWDTHKEFWQEWTKNYSAEDKVYIPEEITKNIPRVETEKIMRKNPEGLGMGLEAIKFKVEAGWPGTASKEMPRADVWKSFTINFAEILKISLESQSVHLDEQGYLKAQRVKPQEEEGIINTFFRKYLLAKEEVSEVNPGRNTAETGEEMFKEFVYNPDTGRWDRVLLWGGDKGGILEGLVNWGIVNPFGGKPRALTEKEFYQLKPLKYLSDTELAGFNIEPRKFNDNQKEKIIYILKVNGKKIPLNLLVDAQGKEKVIEGADGMLILPLGDGKFAAVELGIKGLEKAEEILNGIGAVRGRRPRSHLNRRVSERGIS